MQRRNLALALALAMAGAAPASALTTLTFTGTITSRLIPAGSYYAGVAVGDTMTLQLTFDETALDANADPATGDYTSSNAAIGIVATIDGLPVSTGPALPSVGMAWQVVRPAGGTFSFQIGGGYPVSSPPFATPTAAGAGNLRATWLIRNFHSAALPSDSVAAAIASLQPGASFDFTFLAADGFSEFGFPLTNEDIRAALVLVPEPSTLGLVALGIGGIGLARARRNRSQAPC